MTYVRFWVDFTRIGQEFDKLGLGDEAVVEIRNFIEHVLDQFDIHYAAQVRRFYEDRAEHNMVRPTPRDAAADDPPF